MKHKLKDLVELPEKKNCVFCRSPDDLCNCTIINDAIDQIGEIEVDRDELIEKMGGNKNG